MVDQEREKALLQAKLADLEQRLLRRDEDEARLAKLEHQVKMDTMEREIRLAELERKVERTMSKSASASLANTSNAGYASTAPLVNEVILDDSARCNDEGVGNRHSNENDEVQIADSSVPEEVEEFVTEGARSQIQQERAFLGLEPTTNLPDAQSETDAVSDLCICDCGLRFETPGELNAHMQRCTVVHAQRAKRSGLVQPCAACGGIPNKVWWCSQCKLVPYCSRECQKVAWKAHKEECAPCTAEPTSPGDNGAADAPQKQRLDELEELLAKRKEDPAWTAAFLKMTFGERYAVLTCGSPEERREVLSLMTEGERTSVFCKMKLEEQLAVLQMPSDEAEEAAPAVAAEPTLQPDQEGQIFMGPFEGMTLVSLSELVMLGDLHLWKVMHGPRVAVRGGPSKDSAIVGSRQKGRLVLASGRTGKEVQNGWIKLHKLERRYNTDRSKAGYMLVDGAELLNLGVLMKREADSMASMLQYPVYQEMRKQIVKDEKPSDEIDLLHAAREGLPDMLRKCIEMVPERISTWLGEFRSTALHLAAFHGHSECVELLLEAKANMSATNQFEWTPLHCAVGAPMHILHPGHTESMHALIRAKANIQARDKDNRRPIQLCAEFDRPGMLLGLLEAKADVNSTSKDDKCRGFLELGERPPIVSAAETGNVEAVRVLLAFKADIEARTSKGKSAYECAIAKGRDEVLELLVAAGCSTEERPKSAAERWSEEQTAKMNGRPYPYQPKPKPTTSNADASQQSTQEEEVVEVSGVH